MIKYLKSLNTKIFNKCKEIHSFFVKISELNLEVQSLKYNTLECCMLLLWGFGIIFVMLSKSKYCSEFYNNLDISILTFVKLFTFLMNGWVWTTEFRKIVFIYNTNKYSKTVKIIVFFRRILRLLINALCIICFIDLDKLILGSYLNPRDINYYKIINYKNHRGKF